MQKPKFTVFGSEASLSPPSFSSIEELKKSQTWTLVRRNSSGIGYALSTDVSCFQMEITVSDIIFSEKQF